MHIKNALKRIRTSLFYLLVPVLALTSLLSKASTQIHSYNIDVQQHDESNSLVVNTTVTLSSEDFSSVELVLNESAVISSATLNGQSIDFHFNKEKPSPFMYAQNGRSLTFNSDKLALKQASLTIKYRLDIESINYIKNGQHIESGLYSAWYPLNVNYGKFQFNVSWSAKGEHHLIGNGNTIKKDKGWLLSNTINDIDIVVMSAKKPLIKTFTVGNSAVNLISLDANNDSMNKITSDTKQVLAYYQTLLGSSGEQAKRYQFVFVPRGYGPSYSRNQFAVVSQGAGSNYNKLLKTVAHEVGHFWWNKADPQSWQDWLNESFAEYSALMALEDLLGIEHVDALLNEYQAVAKNLPAIKEIKRSSKHAQNVLYKKGPVLLHGLKQQVGEKAFNEWLRKLLAERVSNFDEFVAVSERTLAPKAIEYIQQEVSR